LKKCQMSFLTLSGASFYAVSTELAPNLFLDYWNINVPDHFV